MPERDVPDPVQREYMLDIVKAALESTILEYGDYEIAAKVPSMVRERAVRSLQKGEAINVKINPLKQEFLGRSIIVPIPIRRGILNYRLLVINRANSEAFKKIKVLDDLRPYQAGMYAKTATSKIFAYHGIPSVDAPYQALVPMLARHRFHYLVRGVHEIFYEIETSALQYPGLVIQDTLALNVPLPTLVYVSPKFPRLAKRLEAGLLDMVKTGLLKDIFDRYYREYVVRAKLHERTVIKIDNPLLKVVAFPDIPGLWFHPDEVRP